MKRYIFIGASTTRNRDLNVSIRTVGSSYGLKHLNLCFSNIRTISVADAQICIHTVYVHLYVKLIIMEVLYIWSSYSICCHGYRRWLLLVEIGLY